MEEKWHRLLASTDQLPLQQFANAKRIVLIIRALLLGWRREGAYIYVLAAMRFDTY